MLIKLDKHDVVSVIFYFQAVTSLILAAEISLVPVKVRIKSRINAALHIGGAILQRSITYIYT